MYIPDNIVKHFEDIDNKLYIICSILQIVAEKLATVEQFDDNEKNQFKGFASILDKVISNEIE